MNKKIPLRARKKAQLRQALISASFRLFNQKGYTGTTLEEISAACDVTVQTLLRYFGSKDDLIFARHPAILDKFTNDLAKAVKAKATTKYWLKFLRANTVQLLSDRDMANTYKIIVGAPSLLARFHSITRQYEALVEQALSEEAGFRSGEDMYSTLLAHLLVTAPIEDSLRQIGRGKMDTIAERCDAIADYAMKQFQRPGRRVRQKAKRRLSHVRSAHRALHN